MSDDRYRVVGGTSEDWPPKGWRLAWVHGMNAKKAKGLRHKARYLWGFDLWLGPVPMFKVFAVLSAIGIWR